MEAVTAAQLLHQSRLHPDAYLAATSGRRGWHMLGSPEMVGPLLVLSPGGASEWKPLAEENLGAEVHILEKGTLKAVTAVIYIRAVSESGLPLLALERR